MNTIRELIILEFLARAAVIRTTGSPQAYATDIGEKVIRARTLSAPSEAPFLSVWPQDETGENKNSQVLHRMPILIEGTSLFGKEAVTRGIELVEEDHSVISERILGDLIKAFTSPSWDRRRPVAGSSPTTYLDPYADSIVYQAGGPRATPEAAHVMVGASATFLVSYWTAIGDPYSQ
jgi:hypothetical protein